jgi:dynein heavy chain 2
LFTNEELAKELMNLDSLRNNDNTYTGPANTYAYFVYRIQQNLHIVISMDPTNELFRSRCESNPALFNRCSIQWMDGWTNAGFKHLAGIKLKVLFKQPGHLLFFKKY